jgi:sortase (surface protein transpeptidase)
MRAPRPHLLSLLLAAGAAGLAVAAAVVVGEDADRATAPPPPAPPMAPSATAAHTRTTASVPAPQRSHRRRVRPARPDRVRIPAIGVDARVVPVGVDRTGALEVPRSWVEAGWYARGSRPGEAGPAVIVGHVDSTSGPAVFYRLGALHRGAAIGVAREDGSVARFRVQRVERWSKARFPTGRVYGATRRATLRLITCGGTFNRATGHYTDNTIAYAVES